MRTLREKFPQRSVTVREKRIFHRAKLLIPLQAEGFAFHFTEMRLIIYEGTAYFNSKRSC